MAERANGTSELFDAFHRIRCCNRCGNSFAESANLGRWLCTRYHPAEAMAGTTAQTYACCGKRIGSGGCVRADHSDARYVVDHVMLIARTDAELLGAERFAQRHSWRRDRAGNFLIARRDEQSIEFQVNDAERRHDLDDPRIVLQEHVARVAC